MTRASLQSGNLQGARRPYNEDKPAWPARPGGQSCRHAAQVASLAPVQVATPRLFASGIVATGDQTLGVRIVGIDPSSPANDPFRQGLVSGAFLNADDRDGILIGQTLADKAGLKTGDQFSLSVNTANGDVAQQTFTVRGIFSTGTPSYDEPPAFLPLAKAQAITGPATTPAPFLSCSKTAPRLGRGGRLWAAITR